MKTMTKVSFLLLAFLLPLTALAHDFEIDGIFYNINGNEASVTYKGTSHNQFKGEYTGDVTIPAAVAYNGTTYQVTSIGGFAFYGCPELTSITFPPTVKNVYRYAFNGCTSLTRVNITDLAAWCRINYETGDANPLHIAHHLYLNGTEVRYLEIPNTVSAIGKMAFLGCSGLTYIAFPDTDIAIGDFAFESCDGLSDVFIPQSVKSIGKAVFNNCNALTYIDVSSDNPIYDSRENCSAIIETATNTMVMACKNTFIPNTIEAIGYAAFADLEDIRSISIPSSVKTIGDYAFGDCENLKSVTLNDGLTTIGRSAFDECSSLLSIDIPNTVKTIGMFAFMNCVKLKTAIIGNSVTSIDELAFYYCQELTGIALPSTVTFIGQDAFNDCPSLTSLSVSEGNPVYDSRENCNDIIETSSNTLLYGCQNSTIPNTVTSIQDNAFFNCTGLARINIPAGVTSIGRDAFCFCINLTEVESYISDPSSVTVGENAFYRYPNTYDGRTLHVPFASSSLYQADPNWGPYFGNIVEMDAEPSTSIELDMTEADIIEGKTLELKATVTPINAANKPLEWTSSNPAVATVDNNGLVTSVCVGKTTITATTTDGTNLSATCEVTVKSETADNYFAMPDIYVHPGDTVLIPVRLVNRDPVTWFNTDIYLPRGFVIPTHINEFNGYTDHDIYPTDRLTEDNYIMSAALNDSVVRVFGNNFSNQPLLGNDGDLFYFKVIVPEVVNGYCAIHLRNTEFTFVDDWEYAPDSGAVIYIMGATQGDVNGDGKVTISDVTSLISNLLNNDNPGNAADINGDGKVTISDVTYIINLLLSTN